MPLSIKSDAIQKKEWKSKVQKVHNTGIEVHWKYTEKKYETGTIKKCAQYQPAIFI